MKKLIWRNFCKISWGKNLQISTLCILDFSEYIHLIWRIFFNILNFLITVDLTNFFGISYICDWCISRFFNTYFRFSEYYGNLANIHAYTYVFPCDFAARNNEIDIYGTGGAILEGMKHLMHKLPGLRRVELIDLQLDSLDGKSVFCENFSFPIPKWYYSKFILTLARWNALICKFKAAFSIRHLFPSVI